MTTQRAHIALATMYTALIAAVTLLSGAIPAAASAPAAYQPLVPVASEGQIKKLETITVTAACPFHDADARITAEYPVQWPEIALEQNAAPATSTVQIDLDSKGNLVNASIATSSGNPLFDQEALLGARMSKYAPAKRACASVARSYYLPVRFELAD